MVRMLQIGFCAVALTIGTWLCRFTYQHADAWWSFATMALGVLLVLLGALCVLPIARRW